MNTQAISNILNNHAHRVPDQTQQELLQELRQRTADLAVWLECKLPAGREKALAQTNLEQARMWACSALVATGEVKAPLTLNLPT